MSILRLYDSETPSKFHSLKHIDPGSLMHEWLRKAGKIEAGAGTLRKFLAVYMSSDIFLRESLKCFQQILF